MAELNAVCAHCQERDLDETGEHFCIEAIFYWMFAVDEKNTEFGVSR